MRATIIAGDKKYPLWVNNEAPLIVNRNDKGGDVVNAESKALAFVSELVVEVQLALLPKITVTLTPPFRDAMALMDSTLLTWGVNTIEVQFGYVSDTTNTTVLSPVYSGILMKPEVTFGTDVTITLNAIGVSGLAASQQSGTRTFNSHTRIEIIEALAKGVITTPRKQGELTSLQDFKATIVDPVEFTDADPTSVLRSPRTGNASLDADVFSNGPDGGTLSQAEWRAQKVPKGAPTRDVEVNYDEVKDNAVLLKKLTQDIRASYVQGGRTDWHGIRELCDEIGCTFVMEGKTVKILPRGFTKATKRHFRLFDYPRGVLHPAQGEFPILSATSPSMAMFLPGASSGVVVRGIDEDTKEPKTVAINDGNIKASRSGEGAGSVASGKVFSGVDDTTGDGQDTMPGDPNDKDAIDKAKSEFLKQSNGMGINLIVESLADPRLFPGDIIQVRGLGWRFSGSYAVLKTTHTFGGSGSSMSLECFSNASKVNDHVKVKGDTAQQIEPTIEDTSVLVIPTEQA
jgi:hypothetical protein